MCLSISTGTVNLDVADSVPIDSLNPMARTRTWGDIRAAFVSDARENRTEFVMTVWGGLLGIPMLICAAMMAIGGFQQWLGNTMAVFVVLCFPPSLYFKLRDRSNRGVKRRPYRRVPVAGHEGANGLLRAVSWRWPVVAGSALAVVAYVALASLFILAAPNPFVWLVGLGLLVIVALGVFLSAVVTHPLADRAALRLQAGLELEHPNATFVIFKSDQVCSQIACADPQSVLKSWNDNTFRAVVTVDGDGITVWDQSWGKRINVATIPWSRVEGLRLAIARVRWRFVRGIDLHLASQPGEPDVGVVLPPATFQRRFCPLPDVEFFKLYAQLEEHLRKSKAQEISTAETGELDRSQF